MASLIVNADDLGADPDIDRGIFEAFRHGILTSATLLTTLSTNWEAAAREATAIGLPFGIHLSLTHGRPAAKITDVPDLIDSRGEFSSSADRFLLMPRPTSGRDAPVYAQIRSELDAQIKAVHDRAFPISHLDSHQHVHMNPAIFKIVEELAERYGIRAIRIVREPIFGFQLRHLFLANLKRKNQVKVAFLRLLSAQIAPRLRTNDYFYGVAQSGNVDKVGFLRFLQDIARSDRLWEAGIHPGYSAPESRPDHGRFASWFISPARKRELDVLLDPEVKELVRKARISLVSYAT